MAESGQVIERKDSTIVVRLERQEACAKCRACVAGLESKDMFIEAENLCDADVGDWVNITLEQSRFLKAVIIVYTLPLIAMLIGLFLGYYIFQNEVGALIVGFAFITTAFLTIKLNNKRFNSGKYRPIAEEKIKKDE